MYTHPNFGTKKALKLAVKGGALVTVFSPAGLGTVVSDGKVAVEGPHWPKPHTWYAEVTVKDGRVVKVH